MMCFRGNSIGSIAVIVLLCTVFGEALNGVSRMLKAQTELSEKKYERLCEDMEKLNLEALDESF